jgi:hypothetical protein
MKKLISINPANNRVEGEVAASTPKEIAKNIDRARYLANRVEAGCIDIPLRSKLWRKVSNKSSASQ